jgi:hypothetical protein
MRSRKHYMGTCFDVWNVGDDQPAWFWLVLDSHRDRGTIGSAATEADAIREACVSIDEISSQRHTDLAAWRVTESLDRLGGYLANARRSRPSEMITAE